MTQEHNDALLKPKITTYEQLCDIHANLQFDHYGNSEHMQEVTNPKLHPYDLYYWLSQTIPYKLPETMIEAFDTDKGCWPVREYIRYKLGFYNMVNIWGHRPNLSDVLGPSKHIRFLHVSREDPKLVAYTPDAESGQADRQIRSKFGKYLTKYYGKNMTEAKIKHYATLFTADARPFELHWAEGAEDIERVYRECATQSCMSKHTNTWVALVDTAGKKVHPSHVYDHEDIGCAYVTNEKRQIVARTIVNRKKNTYVRIYGDEYAMKRLLREDHDITECGSLNGARLKRIDLEQKRVVCPYIDGDANRVTVKDDALLISDTDGREHPNYTKAYLAPRLVCGHCSREQDEDNIYHEIVYAPEPGICVSCYQSFTLNMAVSFDKGGSRDPRKWVVTYGRAFRPNIPGSAVHEPYNDTYYNGDMPGLDRYLVQAEGVVGPLRIIETINVNVINDNGDTEEQFYACRMIDEGVVVRVEDSKGARFYLRKDLDAGHYDKTIVFCEHTGSWIDKRRAVEAIHRRDGSKTTIAVNKCFFDVDTDTWYTRNYFHEHLTGLSASDEFPDRRTAIKGVRALRPGVFVVTAEAA